jgi:hypothetical protein
LPDFKEASLSVRTVTLGLAVAALAAMAGGAQAQEDLNRGKTPAQLYASDCVECHRNPRALGQRDDANALAAFLRVHYTASRESAAAIAAYLVGLGKEPQRGAGRPSRPRPASSGHAAQPAAKPAEATTPRASQPAPEPAAASSTTAPAKPPAAAGEPAAATPPADPQ